MFVRIVDPVAVVSAAISALQFVYDLVKSSGLPRAEKQKIAEEAQQIVQIAQMSDIDKELRKIRKKPAAKALA